MHDAAAFDICGRSGAKDRREGKKGAQEATHSKLGGRSPPKHCGDIRASPLVRPKGPPNGLWGRRHQKSHPADPPPPTKSKFKPARLINSSGAPRPHPTHRGLAGTPDGAEKRRTSYGEAEWRCSKDTQSPSNRPSPAPVSPGELIEVGEGVDS